MVLRQTRLIALLLLAAIVAIAIGMVAAFGPDAPLIARPDGTGIITAQEAAVRYCGFAGLWTILYDRAARVRRWRRNVIRAGGTFAIGWIGTMVLVLGQEVIALFEACGHPVARAEAMTVLVAILLLAKANLLPRSRPAWLNGVTLPLFARDRAVWRQVHRWSAMRLVALALGALLLLAAGITGEAILRLLMKLLIAEFCLTTLHALWLQQARQAHPG